MPKKFWQFRNQAAGSAELLLYGDISDSSWWGDEVTPKTFADELNALGALTSLTVRINSGGGDVFAAQTIGNLLEQHTAQVTARIDGLCASAATIIACHCDKVVAANDSTYMIHPVRMGIFDFADAVTLQQYIGALNTIRENILNLYTKKTGREKDEVAAWMDATSWWTGEEAKTNGFVDELVDDGEKTVVENRGGLLFVNSVNMNLPFNKAPKFVQNSVAAAPAASGFVNTPTPAEQPGDNSHKEDTNMANEIKTVDELRQIAELAGRPFILKGIMTVNGAKKALEAGASGIVVSNHGGRVLDQCPATAEVLPAIADAVGGKMTILVDGGIRTGMDVFKAAASRACRSTWTS